MGGTDVAAINQALEALTKAQHTAAENLYKQAQATGAAGDQGGGGAPGGGPDAGATGSAGGKQDDVIDAEVMDEK